MGFRSMRVINEDRIIPGDGFRSHSHRDMEITLCVLKGALEQRERIRRFGNALRLRDRKIANIARTSPALVATGNIGCIAQIASGTSIPVLHTVELLDFAHGGPTLDGLASLAG